MIRYEKKNLIDGRIDGRLFLAGNGAAILRMFSLSLRIRLSLISLRSHLILTTQLR